MPGPADAPSWGPASGCGSVEQQKLKIDWILCDGYSLCADLAPEVIDLDEWGYPIIRPGAIAASELKDVKRAVDSCPMSALTLVPLNADRRGSGSAG